MNNLIGKSIYVKNEFKELYPEHDQFAGRVALIEEDGSIMTRKYFKFYFLNLEHVEYKN